MGERNLFRWTHIFIDEVHERDQTMDFVLLLIKKLCCEIPTTTTKIILMSATVDTHRFCEYFATYQVGCEVLACTFMQYEYFVNLQNGHRPAFHVAIAPDTVMKEAAPSNNFDVRIDSLQCNQVESNFDL